ncbi:Histidine ammonia-lyase [Pseudomonas syringae pv. maculicola]|nr:Histidine ammonia-lyase [Pseudomonas syringae pv. maculicola]
MSRAEQIVIGEAPLGWQDVVAVARHGAPLRLSDAAWARIDNAQAIVQQIVVSGERAYGVNTGLGALCNVSLEGEQLSRLSRNTLLSHACGVGAPLADEQTRAIICAAILNYSQGKSGIHRQVVEALLDLLNRGITPQVPSQGSVGYLTHMAHVGIALLGVGQVSYRGQIVPAEQALKEEILAPVTLGAKDGLCLVNGTPCMTGLSCLAIADAERLSQWADVIGAMTFEALRGQLDAFDERILALKPHPGMQQVGKNLRSMLAGSEVLASSQGIRTQDALSIRSIPQVHGATRDQLAHATRQIETELNSVTDNPDAARHARRLARGVSGQPARPVGSDGGGCAVHGDGRTGLHRRAAAGSPDQPAGQRPAGVSGQPAGGQLGNDDRPVRRRLVVRRKPPVGATGSGRQLRHLRPAGRSPEPGHQRGAQAAQGAGQHHADSGH